MWYESDWTMSPVTRRNLVSQKVREAEVQVRNSMCPCALSFPSGNLHIRAAFGPSWLSWASVIYNPAPRLTDKGYFIFAFTDRSIMRT